MAQATPMSASAMIIFCMDDIGVDCKSSKVVSWYPSSLTGLSTDFSETEEDTFADV